ncbi:hypothetical protein N643_19980 [Salmonella bongori serovar 48:z41:-- str. RKS3044]|nr:hypothetical protein N643_19980 [Salmonella bongori serovar 48:z41:-- str. RKS3044]
MKIKTDITKALGVDNCFFVKNRLIYTLVKSICFCSKIKTILLLKRYNACSFLSNKLLKLFSVEWIFIK